MPKMTSYKVYKPTESKKGEEQLPNNLTQLEKFYQGQNKFSPSFFEWLYYNSSQIRVAGQRSFGAAALTLYTVPANYTFFLTSVMANMSYVSGAAGSECYLGLNGFAANTIIHQTFPTGAPSQTLTESISFNYPVRVESGNNIQIVEVGGQGIIFCAITGFLVQTSLIPVL